MCISNRVGLSRILTTQLCICHQVIGSDFLFKSRIVLLMDMISMVLLRDAFKGVPKLNGPGDMSHSTFPAKKAQALRMLPKRSALLCERESWARHLFVFSRTYEQPLSLSRFFTPSELGIYNDSRVLTHFDELSCH